MLSNAAANRGSLPLAPSTMGHTISLSRSTRPLFNRDRTRSDRAQQRNSPGLHVGPRLLDVPTHTLRVLPDASDFQGLRNDHLGEVVHASIHLSRPIARHRRHHFGGSGAHQQDLRFGNFNGHPRFEVRPRITEDRPAILGRRKSVERDEKVCCQSVYIRCMCRRLFARQSRLSKHGEAAIDVDCRPRHPGRRVAEQIQDRFGDIARLADPSEGM